METMAFMFDAEPLRGDTQGLKGIAREFVQILRRDYGLDTQIESFVTVEGDSTRPDNMGPRIPAAELAQQHDVVFSVYQKDSALHHNITSLNENRRHQSRGKQLVAHSLTPEDLDEQAALFDKRFSKVKGPLIAVFLTNFGFDLRPWDKLVENNPGATIFLVPSHRTSTERKQHIDMHRKLRKRMKETGGAVYSFDYKWRDIPGAFNPYKALLKRADYLVLDGTSTSMRSEALFLGREMNDLHTGKPLCDKRVRPDDGLQKIAQREVKTYLGKKYGVLQTAFQRMAVKAGIRPSLPAYDGPVPPRP